MDATVINKQKDKNMDRYGGHTTDFVVTNLERDAAAATPTGHRLAPEPPPKLYRLWWQWRLQFFTTVACTLYDDTRRDSQICDNN